MIKRFLLSLKMSKLMNESSKTASVFESMSKNFARINEQLFGIKSSKLDEIKTLQTECDIIEQQISKNKSIKNKIDKFLND